MKISLKYLILVCLCTSVWAQKAQKKRGDFILGEGKFYAQSDDSLSFIKSGLINNAFKDIITKKLTLAGMDSELFWNKFNEKFEESFNLVKERLEEKYHVDDPKQTTKQKLSFNNKMRQKRILMSKKFGNLSKVITSYSVVKISRSSEYPNTRYIKLNGKVSRKALNRIYFKYVGGEHGGKYSNIYFSTHFNVGVDGWNDLGVKNQGDFISTLEDSWNNWLITKLTGVVDQVVKADTEIIKSLQHDLRSGQILPSASGEMLAEMSVTNGLWLKFALDIKKIEENIVLKSKTFEFSGSVIVLDVATSEVVLSTMIPPRVITYKFFERSDLSSQIASFVYRMPLAPLKRIKKSLMAIPSGMKKRRLSLYEYKSMAEAYGLMNLLSNMGGRYRLKTSVKSIAVDKVIIEVNFIGDDSNLKSLLSRLKGKTYKGKFSYFVPNESEPYKIIATRSEETTEQ
ncbi:MAG: hypothetical protein HOE90_21500 [Bacteriovoracaceae bacterium]|jgi:hypothetical protein|nr:hypothetical protein [Bacteriovoracaceae bacterium]